MVIRVHETGDTTIYLSLILIIAFLRALKFFIYYFLRDLLRGGGNLQLAISSSILATSLDLIINSN